MTVCVDIGNTSTALGVLEGLRVRSFWRIVTRRHTRDEYANIVRSLLAGEGVTPQGVESAGLCSVVPSETEEMAEGLSRALEVEVRLVDGRSDSGIRITTDNPAEVGGDRIANAVGAYFEYGAPVIVVDLGTATTFDFVSASGEYRGGVIAPGMFAGAADLWARARMLPAVEIRPPASVIGASTVECMKSGIYFGTLAQVEGVLARMWEEIGEKCPVILTGGEAVHLRDGLRVEVSYDPHLTLKGIAFAIHPGLRPEGGKAAK
jgi:type III pantothenate kinase